MRADVLVVGGGPSGLAVAIDMAQRGRSIVVVEPQDGVIDKACGEGLMPQALAALERLGVPPLSGVPIKGITYRQGRHRVSANFPDCTGLGVRRLTLHAALRERAAALGVQWVRGRVDAIREGVDHIEACGVQARHLVGADGLRSGVRSLLFEEQRWRGRPRYAVRQHFRVAPWSDHVEVHWSAHSELYVTPVGPDTVGVAVLYDDRAKQASEVQGRLFERLLNAFPEVEARLHTPASSVRGAGPFGVRCRRVGRGRALLVGDAAGYVDPLTGEGVGMGLASAAAACEAIVNGDVSRYHDAWRQVTRHHRWFAGGLLWLGGRAMLRPLIVPCASAAPFMMRAAVAGLGR